MRLTGSGGRIWPWLLGAFVVFLIVSNPTHAAGMARHLGHALTTTASALGQFIDALTGGGS